MPEILLGPSGLLLLGGFLTLFGAFWAATRQSQFQREALYTVTGGDSFAYLGANAEPASNLVNLVLIHVGQYPLYEVHARIVDVDVPVVRSNRPAEVQSIRLEFGTLVPRHAAAVPPLELGNGEGRNWNVFFTARNGGWNQELRLRKVDGAWRIATRVTRGENYDQVLLQADPAFPRDPEGHLDTLSPIPADAASNQFFGFFGDERLFNPRRRLQ